MRYYYYLPSLFRNRETKQKQRNQPWQWPSCKHPKTLSFRAGEDMYKTVNSVFFETSDGVETTESCFTNSSESPSFSTETEHDCEQAESIDMIVRGARSDRLFFEPEKTSSIIEKPEEEEEEEEKDQEEDGNGEDEGVPFKESVVLAMESKNPYLDFRKSMEEMVECHGITDWEYLEELLSWYLKVNGKKTHGYIVGAFVDMLVDLSSASVSPSATAVCSESTRYSSADSSFASSSRLCSLVCHDEIYEGEKMVMTS